MRQPFSDSALLFAEVGDDMPGADVGAMAALDALGNINHSKIVFNHNGVGRALALALHAADAAEVAHFHDLCALVLVAAGGHNLLGLGDHLDDALGAGVGAGAAANALAAVNLGNTVYNVHGVKLADLNAVTHTNAGKGAGLIALSAEKHGRAAILRTGVVEAHFRMPLGSGAGDKGHHLFCGRGVNTHDKGDALGGLRPAGNAAVYGSLAGSHGGGIAITAGIAAAAAVCAGQAAADGFLLGVNFHIENLGGKGQDGSEDAAQHAQHKYGEKDRSHMCLPP